MNYCFPMADGLALSSQARLSTQPRVAAVCGAVAAASLIWGLAAEQALPWVAAHPLLLSLLLSSFIAHLQVPALMGALQRHWQAAPALSGVQPQWAGR